MADVIHLNVPTALIGRWRSTEDDSRSEYSIRLEHGQLRVTGSDYLDGEQYVISNISYDHDKVEFDTFMPSTSRRGRLTLTKTGLPDRAEIRFTFTDIGTASRLHDKPESYE